MAKCRTNCIEKPVRVCFEIVGHFIGSHPWWFLLAPLVLSAALGSGFYFLPEVQSNDMEEQFTPLDGAAKAERRFFQETFPQEEGLFSSLRRSTDGSYATLIATDRTNVWTAESLQEVLALDGKVRSLTVEGEDGPFQYRDVCSPVGGGCHPNGILDLIGYDASNVDRVNLTFPSCRTERGEVFLLQSLGGVRLENDSAVRSAEAIRLFYYLREDVEPKTNLWLESFLTLLSNESTTSMQVAYSTSMSMQREFENIPSTIIRLFAISYAVAITYCIMSSVRRDNVRSKVWVAVVGVLATGLGVLSSFGLLLLLGQPFVMTVASSPFMILGIGLDDMFILLSSWQKTSVLDGVADRLADTLRDAAISVTITTLTDVLALFLGFSSPFGSVQSFCLYAGTAIFFCFLYNLAFLGAFLALNGRREAGNRHWFTCAQIPEDLPPGKRIGYAVCCVGGAYDRETGAEEEPPMERFFRKHYGPFLVRRWTKACTVVLYAGYLAVGVYGCWTLEEGMDLRNLATDDSYLVHYYNNKTAHFSKYGPVVMVAVNETYPYWAAGGRDTLSSCLEAFQELDYVERGLGFSWLTSFRGYADANRLDVGSEAAFRRHLAAFLELHPVFRQDLNATADLTVLRSRFFIQVAGQGVSNAELLHGLRGAAERCPVALLVYHPSFVYLDQAVVIRRSALQTVMVSTASMLVVSFLLIPSPLCSLWVAFAIGSVMVGVAGCMALWGVSLDSISLINLAICIGFSVDFSAHVSYAFVSSAKTDADQRAVDALANLGYPIMQGALSTILGVLVLAWSGSYIFRTFFKITFLVMAFGLVHGMVFIPVFLTWTGM